MKKTHFTQILPMKYERSNSSNREVCEAPSGKMNSEDPQTLTFNVMRFPFYDPASGHNLLKLSFSQSLKLKQYVFN